MGTARAVRALLAGAGALAAGSGCGLTEPQWCAHVILVGPDNYEQVKDSLVAEVSADSLFFPVDSTAIYRRTPDGTGVCP